MIGIGLRGSKKMIHWLKGSQSLSTSSHIWLTGLIGTSHIGLRDDRHFTKVKYAGYPTGKEDAVYVGLF